MLKKKLNKKGFTLAELLVVIAILAILIAIAIPVFSGMVADANLRVNQANVRNVRSAGVAHILTNLDENDSSAAPQKLNAGLQAKAGWVAVAEVNNNGDIKNLKVFVCGTTGSAYFTNGIRPGAMPTMTTWSSLSAAGGYVQMGDNPKTTEPFAVLKPTTDASGVYTVQAVITDLDPVA